MNDSEVNDTSDLQIERNLDITGNTNPSRSHPQDEPTPQDNSIRKSNCIPIPCRRFEIENEAFIVALHDGDEPRTYRDAITLSTKELWIEVMNG